jgi:hypothetical protein
VTISIRRFGMAAATVTPVADRSRAAAAGRWLVLLAVIPLIAPWSEGEAAVANGESALRFTAAASAVTVERVPGGLVVLDTGTYVVAGADPFEVHAERASYSEPVVGRRILRYGARTRAVPLPAGLLSGFAGFPAFTHVTLKDASGNTVVDRDETFCPNGEPARIRPDAPDVSPYPGQCAPFTPFALGSVWGIEAGWAAPTAPPWWGDARPVDIADGTYSATVSVNEPYRELFGFPAGPSSATVRVTVHTAESSAQPLAAPSVRAAGPLGSRPTGAAAATPHDQARTAGRPPGGPPTVPRGPKPDLRSLPAFEVGVTSQPVDGRQRDLLVFAATVWVAGDSPLVVDGFRRPGQDVMDAYQYFYDASGRQVGWAPVGTMEWDARDGHDHWHFSDFARYQLLDANRALAVRSAKEAFCLASTDPVDYTLPRANWRPEQTDLHSACGNGSSIAVREVLDVGNGDTYYQYLPGQSFDVTDLPNGTYHIEIAANPDRTLHEQNTGNNVSYREVVLEGTPGARTVRVPPVGRVDA